MDVFFFKFRLGILFGTPRNFSIAFVVPVLFDAAAAALLAAVAFVTFDSAGLFFALKMD